MRNGRLAMTLIADYIQQIPRHITCEDFCSGVSSYLHDFYQKNHVDITILESHPEERLAASAAIYSEAHHEVWLIGDCQCLINGQLYENGKPSEKLFAQQRADIILKALANGADMKDFQTEDAGRKAILPALIESMKGQNKTFAVIDGFPIYEPGIKKISTPSSSATEIVLASDGYPFLEPTLEASEQRLQEQLSHDPLNIKTFKATKGVMKGNLSFDDRTYIRFRI